jgi:hypothetical protein
VVEKVVMVMVMVMVVDEHSPWGAIVWRPHPVPWRCTTAPLPLALRGMVSLSVVDRVSEHGKRGGRWEEWK